MTKLTALALILGMAASAKAGVGVSAGHVTPAMKGFGGTVGYGAFIDYVFPGLGLFIGAEIAYWQKRDEVKLYTYDQYEYELHSYTSVLDISDRKIMARLGWQLPNKERTVLTYLGIAPGAHTITGKFTKDIVDWSRGWKSVIVVEDPSTQFGIDFFVDLRFRVSPVLRPFVAVRWSWITHRDYKDFNHLFIGGGLELCSSTE